MSHEAGAGGLGGLSIIDTAVRHGGIGDGIAWPDLFPGAEFLFVSPCPVPSCSEWCCRCGARPDATTGYPLGKPERKLGKDEVLRTS
jgi:hypothetical protein